MHGKFIDDKTGDSEGPTSAIGRMGIDGNVRVNSALGDRWSAVPSVDRRGFEGLSV